MSTVDREALIEAATEAAQRIVASPQFNTNAAQRAVDAVLVATVMPAAVDAVVPLIADAIATSRIEMYDEATPGTVTYDFAVNVKSKAARLVRSLLGTDSPATVSPPSSPPALPETGE